MNWSNVYRIEWNGDASGKHEVCYSGSRSLPAPYVGIGCITLTEEELRSVYLILRREEKRGMPRKILGLDAIAKYLSDGAMKKEDERMKNRVKDLEDRVKELEAIVMEKYLADEAPLEKEDKGKARVKDLEGRVKELETIVATVTKDDDVIFKTAMEENGDGARQDGEEK